MNDEMIERMAKALQPLMELLDAVDVQKYEMPDYAILANVEKSKKVYATMTVGHLRKIRAVLAAINLEHAKNQPKMEPL